MCKGNQLTAESAYSLCFFRLFLYKIKIAARVGDNLRYNWHVFECAEFNF